MDHHQAVNNTDMLTNSSDNAVSKIFNFIIYINY